MCCGIIYKANIFSMAESKGWVNFARDNFQIYNVNYMKKLWVKQDFTDVTLVADDGIVRSHKVVLAAGSSVFQDLLGGVLRDQTCPCIFLWGVKKKQLDLLLDFLYCGETDMAEEDMSFFLELSKRIGLVGLQLEPRTLDETLPGINPAAKLEDEGAFREELFFDHETALKQEEEPKKSLKLKPRTKDENLPEMNHEAKLEDEEDFREELFFDHETALKLEEPKKSLKMRRIVPRKFPCDQCPYRHKDRNGLKMHVQKKHTGREGGFECKRVWCLAELRKAFNN